MLGIDNPSASVCVPRSTLCVIGVYGPLLGSTSRDISWSIWEGTLCESLCEGSSDLDFISGKCPRVDLQLEHK